MSEKEIHEAMMIRLEQIRHDRSIVRKRIRRSSDKQVIRGLRRLNNVLEATERALENV